MCNFEQTGATQRDTLTCDHGAVKIRQSGILRELSDCVIERLREGSGPGVYATKYASPGTNLECPLESI